MQLSSENGRHSRIRTYDRATSVVFLKTNEAFGGLSNMAGGFPLLVNGIRIFSSEALYQACRFPHRPDVQRLIIAQTSPMTAKMKSKPYRRDSRPDWERVRAKIMRWCLRVKLAQNWEKFSRLLLQTGDRPIVEESRNDDFWGAKPIDEHKQTLAGMNVLGRLLMELREAVKTWDPDSLLRVEALDIPDFVLDGRPIQTIYGGTTRARQGLPNLGELRDNAEPSPAQPWFFNQQAAQGPLPRFGLTFSSTKVTPAAGTKRYKPYPAYKDSGVEWLGEIPAHWDTKRLKHLASLNDETLPEDTAPDRELRYVDISSVDTVHGITRKEGLLFGAAPSRARRVVRHGDVIVSTVRTYLRAIVSISDPDPNLIVSTGFAVVRPRPELDTAFASYVLQAPYFIERVVANSVGVSYPAINASQIASFSLAVPSVNEQQAIAIFLKHETTKIDTLIAKKERLIKLLQEKRTALITQAVTKGFDSNVPVSDTGAIIFPQVPRGWQLRKLRRLIRQVKRPVEVDPETEYREIGIRSWGRGIFHKEPVRGALLEDKSVFRIEPGDFVLNIVFAWEGAVAIATEQERGMVGSHRFPTFRCSDEVDLDYILMVLQTEQGRALMEVNSPGAAGRNKTIRLNQLLNEEIPLPPLSRQREIVNRFRGDAGRLDALLARLRDAVDHLKELRAALISAAVTGKIDVQDSLSEETNATAGME
jgi:type I restriction enzyme, S subunit